MALGSQYSSNGSNNANKTFEPTVYSRIKIKNKDKKVVSFSFNKGLLRISIGEEVDGFRTEEVAAISLSYQKAAMLRDELNIFTSELYSITPKRTPEEAFGVISGLKETVSFIAFKLTGNKTESGTAEHQMIIGKITKDGVVESHTEFTFNHEYNYYIDWSNFDSMESNKVYDNTLDIVTVYNVLNQFVESASGAAGFYVWDTGRYITNNLTSKIDSIMDKMGIERQHRSSENYFDKQSSSSKGNSTNIGYDEMENMIDESGYEEFE